MKKMTLILIFIFTITDSYSQALFDRTWGSGSKFNPKLRVAEVNPNSNELFLVYDFFAPNSIYSYNINNSSTKVFYEFPSPKPPLPNPNPSKYIVLTDQLKFDSNNDLIVYGRTHNPDLGTTGTYSKTTLQPTIFSGHSFIAKINKQGNLVWLTYFHDMSQHKSSLTVDSNNNIYVINKRHKNDILSPSFFKNSGDATGTHEYQDVISKIDTNGKHIWSTFYYNDQSEINSIVAANDGLYVYGEYTGSNTSNNYFSTKNSYQEFPSGFMVLNDKSTVFLSKFGFDGKRLWSTYFGNEITKIPVNNSSFPQSIVSIGNDVYFLTSLRSSNSTINNIATPNSFITSPPDFILNTSLTKFLGNGKRDWTTYLYSGESLQKTYQNELLVTSNIDDTHSNINNLTTLNAYQTLHAGMTDIYTSIISNDGKSLKYGSFYGYEGNDLGVTFVNRSGFYVYGYSTNNSIANSLFSTKGETFSGNSQGGYWGYFSGYFLNKTLNNQLFEKELEVSIYPNPTKDIINIQSKENLPENTSFTIYDLSGKIVLNHSVVHSNLNQINVSNLSSGAYILQINNPNIHQSFKFIKK